MGKRLAKTQVQVGSKVVCINDDFEDKILLFYTHLPIKNNVYTIRDMSVGISINGEAGEISVTLQEFANPSSEISPYPERGFNVERFCEIEPPAEVEAEELAEMEA